jgi:RNA polymerase sigma-70 factor, ECF subfamily
MSDSKSSIERDIQKAREDQAVLGQLLERYRAFLRVAAERDLNGAMKVRCDASDIVQETLLEAAEGFEHFKGCSEREFFAWFMNIYANNKKDAYRQHIGAEKRSLRREQRPPADDESPSFIWIDPAAKQASPSQNMIRGERALRLAAVLQSLPDAQRKAVILRHLEGLTLDEIAIRLDRSHTAAAGLIKRGLEKLRQNMSESSWL